MLEQRDLLNVRYLALMMIGAPLALLLLFSAIDISWTRISQSLSPSKSNVISETTPKIQAPKNVSDR